MSWDSYVTNMEGEGCQYSGFFDQQGNKWAESPNACLKVQPTQIDSLVKGLKANTIQSGQSVMLGESKFLVVGRSDDTAVMKQMGSAGEGSEKMMACLSMFNSGVCLGAACGEREKCSRTSAEKYAQYLKSQNM